MKLSAACLCVSFLIAHASFGASVTLTSGPANARPLLDIAQQLEAKYGWRLTYEEGPVRNTSDLQDNVPPFAKMGHITLPVPVRKHSTVHFVFDEPVTRYDRRVEVKVIDALLQGYKVSNNLQYFDIRHSGNDYSHIVQIATKDENGNVIPFQPLLDTPVTFPKELRQVDTIVKLILRQVAEKRNVGITEGMLPTMLFRQVQVEIGANGESARSVLMKILDAAQLQRADTTRITWLLYYDNPTDYYIFHAYIIAGDFKRMPVTEAVPSAAQTPVPHPANAWFRKAAQ